MVEKFKGNLDDYFKELAEFIEEYNFLKSCGEDLYVLDSPVLSKYRVFSLDKSLVMLNDRGTVKRTKELSDYISKKTNFKPGEIIKIFNYGLKPYESVTKKQSFNKESLNILKEKGSVVIYGSDSDEF